MTVPEHGRAEAEPDPEMRRSRAPRGMRILAQVLGRHAPARLSPARNHILFVYTLLWTTLCVVTVVSGLGILLGLLNQTPQPHATASKASAPATNVRSRKFVDPAPVLRNRPPPYPNPRDFDDTESVVPVNYESTFEERSRANPSRRRQPAFTGEAPEAPSLPNHPSQRHR
jgi:hypothetical protein